LSDVGHFQQINVDSNVDVTMALAPHFGVAFTPIKQLRLAATAHSPQKLDIGTNFTFLLSNGLEQSAKVSFTHDYVPWQFGLGGAWDMFNAGGSPVTLAATVVHQRWSTYLDRHSEHPDGAYRWYDTFTGTAGLRYAPGALHTMLDVTYVPSPVPDQVGRTNYVDNDRIGVSGGADYGVPLFDGTLRFGAQAQLHRLLPRETHKQAGVADPVVDEVPDDAVINSKPIPGSAGLQTNNPGWPGYASNGWIIGAGAYLRYTH
jgi:long-chain fatty acid transport protein